MYSPRSRLISICVVILLGTFTITAATPCIASASHMHALNPPWDPHVLFWAIHLPYQQILIIPGMLTMFEELFYIIFSIIIYQFWIWQ